MVHHDKCPLCSSGKMRIKLICTDHFVSREVFVIEKCEECGFLFTQDHPSESDAGKYYESEDYISHSDTSKGIINRLYRFSRNVMLQKKANLVKKVTGLQSGKLLDVGSGTGYFAGYMKNKGWNTAGIEISPKARELSIKQFDFPVFDPSGISTLEFSSFDCITLWHVLEHFNDPVRYMEDITSLLKPAGKVVIALPNSNSFDASKYKEYWAAWDVPRHLSHFSPATFRRFAEKTGFKIEQVTRLPLDVFYISLVSEKYKGSKIALINGMLTGIWFWLLSTFDKSRSSSLIYILSKKA